MWIVGGVVGSAITANPPFLKLVCRFASHSKNGLYLKPSTFAYCIDIYDPSVRAFGLRLSRIVFLLKIW